MADKNNNFLPRLSSSVTLSKSLSLFWLQRFLYKKRLINIETCWKFTLSAVAYQFYNQITDGSNNKEKGNTLSLLPEFPCTEQKILKDSCPPERPKSKQIRRPQEITQQ